MHDSDKTKYPYASLTEALHRTLNKKQHEKDKLIKHTKILNQTRDVFKYLVGP